MSKTAGKQGTRIYLVTDNTGQQTAQRWLVDATSQARARAAITTERFVVTVPSAAEVVALMRADVPVITDAEGA